MRITSELLKKYDLSDEAIKSFNDKYPNGAEIIDVLNSGYSVEYLHFIKKYFELSEEEEEAYLKACGIDRDSKDIWHCKDVTCSSDIVHSEKISHCRHIRVSENVSFSSYITNSKNIDTSKDIFFSSQIKNSYLIGDSKNVNRSNNVLNSNNVVSSDHITFSSTIQNSQFIYKSNDLIDCYFSGFMNNCKHCMFCIGLTDAEYYVFNKKVTRAQFERIREDLILMLSAEACNQFITRDDSEYFSLSHFHYSNRFDSIFRGLSSEFIDWIKSLPEYNEDIFLQIFLSSEILKNN